MDDLILVDRVPVEFTGPAGREGPLTLGQLNVLDWIGDNARDYFGVSELVLEVPPDATIADVTETFAVLLHRHESLRTNFTYVNGEPRQTIAQSGELLIDVYEIPESIVGVTSDTEIPFSVDALTVAGATSLSGALLATMRKAPFRLAEDLLIRVAVAVRDGVVWAAATVCSHMVADVGAMMVLGRQFTELAGAATARGDRTGGWQPLDQAAAERSPRGRRQSDATLRYWEQTLAWMPHCMYAMSTVDDEPTGALAAWLHSPALALGLPHVVARTGGSPAMVIAAALAAVMARRTVNPTCVFRFISSNRVGAHLHDYVGTIAQESLLVVDTRTDSFDELTRRCGTASFKAGKYGMFETDRLIPLAHGIEHRRGLRFHRDGVLNNLTVFTNVGMSGGVDPQGTGSAPPGAATEALPQTSLVWWEPTTFNEALVEFQVVQTASWISLGLWTGDRRRVPHTEIENLLRGVDRLVAAAARADVDLARLDEICGIAPVVRGAGWSYIDHSWVELAAVRRLLDEVLDTPAAVFTEVDEAGAVTLVAHLVATERVPTPLAAHQACMDVLAGRFTTMTPARYVLHRHAPADLTDRSQWHRLPVLAAGDGRRRPAPEALVDGHRDGDH